MFSQADRWVRKVASHLQYDDQEDLRSELYLMLVQAGPLCDRALHNKLKATVRKWWRRRRNPVPMEVLVASREDHVQEIETEDLIQHVCHGPLDRRVVDLLMAGHTNTEISSFLDLTPERVARIKKKVAARVKRITKVRPHEPGR